MSILGQIFGQQNGEEPLEAQFQDVKELGSYLAAKHSGARLNEACDEIQNASGLFGYAATNPIPVNGPKGECVYLHRLRSKSGVGCFYHRIGSISVKSADIAKQLQAIDVFEVVASDASQWATLYFHMYYTRRSQKCPEGFNLLPWKTMSNYQRISFKFPFGGRMSKVDNFPFGLPAALENCPNLKFGVPEIGAAHAKIIRNQLSQHAGCWQRPTDRI